MVSKIKYSVTPQNCFCHLDLIYFNSMHLFKKYTVLPSVLCTVLLNVQVVVINVRKNFIKFDTDSLRITVFAHI